MSIRFTTAGESHGPGLTTVVEGLPAGLELTPEDLDADLARRQLGHGRGGRMKIESDRATVTAGAAPRAHAGQPGGDPDREPRLPQLGGADEPLAGGRRRGGGAPAAARATPTSPASRSTASTTCATCSSAPAPARRRRAWPPAAWPRRLLQGLRGGGAQPRDPDRLGGRARRGRAPRWRTSRAWTSRPCAAWTPRPARRWWPRSTPPGRPTSRWAACTRCARSAWCPGIGSHVVVGDAARRPPGRRGDVDPGDEGRRDRRRLRPRGPRGLRGPRRDLLHRGRGLSPRDQPRRRRWRAA